jgi:hypothetical protein
MRALCNIESNQVSGGVAFGYEAELDSYIVILQKPNDDLFYVIDHVDHNYYFTFDGEILNSQGNAVSPLKYNTYINDKGSRVFGVPYSVIV